MIDELVKVVPEWVSLIKTEFGVLVKIDKSCILQPCIEKLKRLVDEN